MQNKLLGLIMMMAFIHDTVFLLDKFKTEMFKENN